MGLYDYVDGLFCPTCKVELEDAQTKNGSRSFFTLYPGCVFTEPKWSDEHPDRLIAYGRCPVCHIMWDVFIPIIRVTEKCVLSADSSTYEYEEARWALSYNELQELMRQGLR